MPKGFTLMTDEQAKELARVCPPHKVVLDCGWEIPVAANAVGCGAQAIERLIAPYHERILENPELKATVGKYALRAHEITKILFGLAQEFGYIGYEIGIAIERAGYKEKP
jgi:hypothetical protein